MGELTEWGFSNDELQFYEDEPEQGLIDDDEIPEVEEAVTKLGDLWLLGEHRVLCGDATKKEDVERLMDNQKADMVFTDPPYGINVVKNNQIGGDGAFGGKKNLKNNNKDYKAYQLLGRIYKQKKLYIPKSCIIKKKIVEKDFKEKNLRKTLNLGHTFGHAYEACLGYSRKLNHGEAVILGIASATAFSYLNKLLNFSNYKLILNHISKISKNLELKKYFRISNY